MLTEFCAQGAGSFEGVDELPHAPFLQADTHFCYSIP